MSPKYSTSGSDADHWTDDQRLVLFQCTRKPFNNHRDRHVTVELRLAVEFTRGVGGDVVLEARSADTEKFDDDWEVVESVEIRDGFARHDRQQNARWLD